MFRSSYDVDNLLKSSSVHRQCRARFSLGPSVPQEAPFRLREKCAHAYAYVKLIKTPLLRTVVGTVGTVVETAVETVAKTIGTVTFLLGVTNLTPFNENLTVSIVFATVSTEVSTTVPTVPTQFLTHVRNALRFCSGNYHFERAPFKRQTSSARALVRAQPQPVIASDPV